MGTCGASVKILDKVRRLGWWKRKTKTKHMLHWFLEALSYHLGYVIMVLKSAAGDYIKTDKKQRKKDAKRMDKINKKEYKNKLKLSKLECITTCFFPSLQHVIECKVL